MGEKILITGGAGFIGSHLADHLILHGYEVRALDNLDAQVHGPNAVRPAYLHPDVELMVGDVRDIQVMRKALDGVGAVFHFAAIVGLGRSMYDIARYTSVNNFGTSVLMEALIEHPVRRLILGSCMSLYGEGLYRASDGHFTDGAAREIDQLRESDWTVHGNRGEQLSPIPTPEYKRPKATSLYGLTKHDQERMCMMIGQAYGIPTVSLRFFNVFGSRQSLSNPYAGVIAIFATRLMNDNPPIIYEDGSQRRDFVSVFDAVQACKLALEVPDAVNNAFNVGSGVPHTVRAIAESMAIALGKRHIQPEITAKYRVGDVRHCFADISLAQDVLGYEPRISLAVGLADLGAWLLEQKAEDKAETASAELTSRGLVV